MVLESTAPESTDTKRPRRTAGFVLTVLALTSAVQAQMAPRQTPPESSPQQLTGWHVVRTGESLRGVTALYLGSGARWQENHRLNPQIADPNLIRTGQRLRVLLGGELPSRVAIIERLTNRVESLLNPLTWQTATVRELLRGSDAVRTFENASAELSLAQHGSLIVTEESIVYLRTSGPRVVRREAAEVEVEIEVGQADYAASTGARPNCDGGGIEIVLGAARATPEADEEGNLFTRARVDTA